VAGGSTNALSAANSAIVAGTNNTLSNTTAGILAGRSNNCSRLDSVILGGDSNNIGTSGQGSGILAGTLGTIQDSTRSGIIAGNGNAVTSSDQACVVGGGSNTVTSTATSAVVVGGSTNTITTAVSSTVLGGTNNTIASGATAASVIGSIGGNATMQTQVVHSGGYTASVGERQRYELVLRGDTPGSVAGETSILKFGVAAGAPTQEITLVNGKSYTIKALVNATRSGAANVATSASWEILASAYCTGGVVTVAANNTVNLPAVLPGGLLGATIVFSGSGTTLRLTATIAGGTTLASKWAADVIVVENLA